MASSLMKYYVLKYDISLPLQNYYDIVPQVKKHFGSELLHVIGYGHIGNYKFTKSLQIGKLDSKLHSQS